MPGTHAPAETRFWRQVASGEDHDLWTGSTRRGGYGQFWDGEKIVGAHRFAWELEHGPIPDGLCALHHCDIPACVRVAHLFLGDRGANGADRAAKGRTYRVPRDESPTVKLRIADITAARDLVGAGQTVRAAARRFGVHETTLGRALGRYH